MEPHRGTLYARMAADSGVEEIVTEVVVPKGSASVRVGTTFECRRLASDGHRHSPCAKVACCGCVRCRKRSPWPPISARLRRAPLSPCQFPICVQASPLSPTRSRSKADGSRGPGSSRFIRTAWRRPTDYESATRSSASTDSMSPQRSPPPLCCAMAVATSSSASGGDAPMVQPPCTTQWARTLD